MAPIHGPTYGYGPIPFMAMAHSIHGHGAFHLWPWRIPFMAIALFHSWPWPHSIHGQGSHLSPRPCYRRIL